MRRVEKMGRFLGFIWGRLTHSRSGNRELSAVEDLWAVHDPGLIGQKGPFSGRLGRVIIVTVFSVLGYWWGVALVGDVSGDACLGLFGSIEVNRAI